MKHKERISAIRKALQRGHPDLGGSLSGEEIASLTRELSYLRTNPDQDLSESRYKFIFKPKSSRKMNLEEVQAAHDAVADFVIRRRTDHEVAGGMLLETLDRMAAGGVLDYRDRAILARWRAVASVGSH